MVQKLLLYAFDLPMQTSLLQENVLVWHIQSQLIVVTLRIHLIFYNYCSYILFLTAIGHWLLAIGILAYYLLPIAHSALARPIAHSPNDLIALSD